MRTLFFRLCRAALLGAAFSLAGSASPRASDAFVITNAAQLRALSTPRAQQHLPARLCGVVLGEAEPDGHAFVLWDGTTDVYALGPTNSDFHVRRGDFVAVEGATDPGGFAPILLVRKLQNLGTRETPPPRPVSFEQLITGDLDCQWVEVSGIVRDCTPMPWDKWKSEMKLATGGGRLTVQINNQHSAGAYVDAEVRIQGICFYQYNKNRQSVRPLLLMPRGIPVLVEKMAPDDLYASPPATISNLFQFVSQGSYGHRVHVRGTVTFYNHQNTLWIADASGGLRIQTHQADALQPGDRVDVLGFPSHGNYSPMLEDAEYHKIDFANPPPPRRLARTALALNCNSELLQVEGDVVDRRQVLDGWALTIHDGDATFDALLHVLPVPPPLLQQWQPGSRLRLTGICSVNVDDPEPVSGIMEPHSFQLLLRSATDVAVVHLAPWWNWQRIAWLLTSLLFALVLVIALIMSRSRRHLREQALQRTMAEREFFAVLKERNRAAREIHDTLSQGLGAISIQLELVRNCLPPDSNPVLKHLQLAHVLVRNSLKDTRSSIWNMRSQVLENGDLASALDGILRQLTDGTGIKYEFHTPHNAKRLAPIVENDVLRIGQEAITNAVKHAGARNIVVTLECSHKTVSLRVRDDGKGFDADNPPRSAGGFGLMGMRERASHLQGHLTIASHPGRGTDVFFELS